MSTTDSTPTPADRYPAEVVIYCDNCGAMHRGTYMVTDECDQATRFGYARTHLREERGWAYGERGDLCGDCAHLPTRQQVWDVIACVREAKSRLPQTYASTDDIIDALVDAGLLNLRSDHG